MVIKLMNPKQKRDLFFFLIISVILFVYSYLVIFFFENNISFPKLEIIFDLLIIGLSLGLLYFLVKIPLSFLGQASKLISDVKLQSGVLGESYASLSYYVRYGYTPEPLHEWLEQNGKPMFSYESKRFFPTKFILLDIGFSYFSYNFFMRYRFGYKLDFISWKIVDKIVIKKDILKFITKSGREYLFFLENKEEIEQIKSVLLKLSLKVVFE